MTETDRTRSNTPVPPKSLLDPTGGDEPETTIEWSEANKAAHAEALAWSERLAIPHALAWVEGDYVAGGISTPDDRADRRRRSALADYAALQAALSLLFAKQAMPAATPEEIRWRRDVLGKPFVTWHGETEAWANGNDLSCGNLHISNTHDGGAHLVLAAYDPDLVGIGIDLVHLPRLRSPIKNAAYLRRFARGFMDDDEYRAFLAAAPAGETEEELRVRAAAHFSLMEAASKACGTGLKLGIGMGRPESLSPRSLGVAALRPEVALTFGPEAVLRLQSLGARGCRSFWNCDGEMLVSVVLLSKTPRTPSQIAL